MTSFQENIIEYRKQLKKGAIQAAYKGLMQYIMDLRIHFKNTYPDFFVSGSIYYGTMDMTYFAIFPKSIKQRNLKIAIVFVHEVFRFEAWLAGANRQVQQKYWQLIKESDWNLYRIVPSTKGVDSIIEHTLADNPDFGDPDALTRQIERETLIFTRDVESFLSNHTDWL